MRSGSGGRRATAALIAWVTLFLPACGNEAGDPPEIRVGLLALLQGIPKDTSGLPSVFGAQLAVREANEGGGIAIDGVPHRVVLIIKSYEDRADSATNEARALINQERIDVLVGPQFSRHAIPVSVVAENARLPMLSPMSSNPATTEGKEYVFRLAFQDDVQGDVMGRFARNELGVSRAAVLYDISTAYGRSLSHVFRRAFEQEGGTVTAFESYARDEPFDLSRQLEVIRDSDPEVLYLPNDTVWVEIQVGQARKLGIDAVLLGGDTWDMEAFKRKPECNGSYVAHQWHPEMGTPEARRFVEEYRRAHGDTPRVTAAMTYDSVRLLTRVIEAKASKDPESIRNGLRETTGFVGATGAISFAGSADPDRSVVISRLHDGDSSLYRVVDP